MAISIPDSTFDIYYEICDWFLSDSHMSNLCTLVYPPIREVCTSCVINPVVSGSTNVYQHGGPAPFSFSTCPLCGGNGYKETVSTSSIRLRVYWSRKDWLKISGSVNVQDAEAQVIGAIADLPNLLKAVEIKIINTQHQTEYKMVLSGEPFLWGFGKDKYFVAYLRRL